MFLISHRLRKNKTKTETPHDNDKKHCIQLRCSTNYYMNDEHVLTNLSNTSIRKIIWNFLLFVFGKGVFVTMTTTTNGCYVIIYIQQQIYLMQI